MMQRLRADQTALGGAYHDLFLGRDTDEAEAAAQHLSQAVEIFIRQNTRG